MTVNQDDPWIKEKDAREEAIRQKTAELAKEICSDPLEFMKFLGLQGTGLFEFKVKLEPGLAASFGTDEVDAESAMVWCACNNQRPMWVMEQIAEQLLVHPDVIKQATMIVDSPEEY